MWVPNRNLTLGDPGRPASVRGWACLAVRSTRVGGPERGPRGARPCLGREGPSRGRVGAQPARALTAALAPSLPPSALPPPSLRGRGRVSAARRPGNAADAPRSIPGGGSAPVLQHRRRRGLSRALSRRPAQGQGDGRAARRGSRRPPPFARHHWAPGSSAWRGAACRRPRARRDLLLLKPERDSGSPERRPRTRSPPGGLGVSSAGSGAHRPLAPLALRLRLQRSPPARRSFRFSSSQGCVLLTTIVSGVRRGKGELASHRLDKLQYGGVSLASCLPVRGGAGVPPGLRGCSGEVQRYVVPRAPAAGLSTHQPGNRYLCLTRATTAWAQVNRCLGQSWKWTRVFWIGFSDHNSERVVGVGDGPETPLEWGEGVWVSSTLHFLSLVEALKYYE